MGKTTNYRKRLYFPSLVGKPQISQRSYQNWAAKESCNLESITTTHGKGFSLLKDKIEEMKLETEKAELFTATSGKWLQIWA